MNIELRTATSEDETFLAELDAEVQSAELASAGLPPAALAPLLAMQHRARTLQYVTSYPNAESSILWLGTERVGRLLVNPGENELRLIDIAVQAAHRGRGIGTDLLRGLSQRAQESGVPLRLSVRAGNPAASLYQRFGFVLTGGDAMYLQMEFRGERAPLPTGV